ncbi:hypothetical protein [Thermomonospora echinospora]|uniref:hypothetical protein n=1 Tax=Thermomonospora echinospora TaxID=1992 RepID=UPI000CDE7683|nr:hypothetical protein [Thermomonospora echinospora]
MAAETRTEEPPGIEGQDADDPEAVTPKAEDTKAEDTKAAGTKAAEPGAEDPKTAKPKAADSTADEPKTAASDAADSTATDSTADEPKTGKTGKAEADGEGRGRPGAFRHRVLSGAALTRAAVLIALVASVITAGLQWHQADQAEQREADRRAVRARAGEFGQALLSYDHRNLQAARNRVLSLASDDFAKTYDAAFTGGLEGVIAKLKADATATVRAVYLGDIEGSTARAIVVMDSEVHSSAGTRRVLGSHLDMRLTRTGERWRVTEVTSIGAADETMTDGEGGQRQGDGAPLPAPSASPSSD